MRHLPVWLVVVLLLAAPFALADDDKDEEDRDREDKRKLELNVDDLKATIKLEREIGELEDAVKIEYDAQKAKLQVKHEEKNETTESEQKLEARFLALLEYVDADGDGEYDTDETIASAWALSDSEQDAKIATNGTVEWGDIAVTDASSGNSSGKKLSSRASFGANASFGLDLFVYGDFTLIGNSSLAPTEAKIDIIIEHYPYTRDDSALAVIVDLKAKEELKDEREDEDEDEEGISSEVDEGNLTFRLTFTWLKNVTVDGVDREIGSTVLKNKAEAKGEEIGQKARVVIAYPRGDVIVHDPTVGVEYGTQSSDARAVPAPALFAALLVVAVAAFVTRRRE